MPVLFDRPGRRPGQIAGRSPYLQAVHVDLPGAASGGGRLPGGHAALCRVRIDTAHANSLAGTLVGPAEPAAAAPTHALKGAA